jgi:hypothetical protein
MLPRRPDLLGSPAGIWPCPLPGIFAGSARFLLGYSGVTGEHHADHRPSMNLETTTTEIINNIPQIN